MRFLPKQSNSTQHIMKHLCCHNPTLCKIALNYKVCVLLQSCRQKTIVINYFHNPYFDLIHEQ
jgi:hypothetical protein